MPNSRRVPQAQVRRRGLDRVGPVTAAVAVVGTAATVTVAVGLAVSRADASNAPSDSNLVQPSSGTSETSTADDPGPTVSKPQPAATQATPRHHHHAVSSGS